MTYDYECVHCGHIQEEWHGMRERPLVHCDKCRGACVKLLSAGAEISGMRGGSGLYDFVDYKTTGKPIRIHNKRQWNDHLKRIGQIQASDAPPSASEIASTERTKKMYMKRELKETIVKAVKDKKHINEVKQKYASKIR